MTKDLIISKSRKQSESNSEKTESYYYSTNETEKEIKPKERNEFIYFTPISYEKKNYVPSTPRKKRAPNENNEFTLIGRNLLSEFESL